MSRMKRLSRIAVNALLIVLVPSALAQTGPVYPDRPQTPRAPFPYVVEDVSFAGAGPGVVLAGSFTRPSAKHPLPAVVLVHGSGMTDRDSTLFGHKPFLVLADALTRAGYAVLRYDKRGVGKSSGDFRAASTLDFATDATAAIRYLRARSEVDPKRVALVGHSEGGMIAGLLYSGNDAPAASISLNGVIAPFSEQMRLQEVLTGEDLGANDAYPAMVDAYYARIMAILRIDDESERSDRMSELSSEWRACFPKGHVNHVAAEDSLLSRPRLLASPWFRTIMRLDVSAAIRQGKGPILLLNGSSDRQVVAEPNLKAAREALGTETPLRRAQLLPRINHPLQESASGDTEEYEKITQSVAPIVIDAVIEFLCLTVGKCQGAAQNPSGV